jgi:hypothetical protein
MSRFKSAAYLCLSSSLLLAAACHRHGRGDGPEYSDGSVDSAEVGDGGLCFLDAISPSECGATTVVINGRLNFCPRIALEITPLHAALQQGILVTSQTVDPEGDAFSLDWSAEPDGHFDRDDAARTYYRCASLGRKTLRVVASDEHGCESSEQVEVSCVE